MEYEYIKKCLQLIVGLFAMALIINCSSDGDSQGGSTPIIIVTGNITSFESVNAGSVSASQNIQVSANDLTGSLIVKTSNNFEISIDNASFSNQVTINKNDVKLQANAYFKNPNDVGCEVVDTEIKVFVNDLYISDVKQANLIELKAKNEFFVPLKVSIPLNKISKDKSGMLGGMLSVLTNKNVSIKYEGFVTIRKAGISYDIEVIGEEVIKEFKKL